MANEDALQKERERERVYARRGEDKKGARDLETISEASTEKGIPAVATSRTRRGRFTKGERETHLGCIS